MHKILNSKKILQQIKIDIITLKTMIGLIHHLDTSIYRVMDQISKPHEKPINI
ncbi:hypothetical protein Hanom_Chr16g01497081 [Helianthus anomalus]